MDLHKILKIVALVLSVIGAVFALIIMAGDETTSSNMSGYMLIVSYVVLLIVLVLVAVFVVKGVLSGDVKKTMMTVGAFLSVILLSYLISSGTDLDLSQFTNKGEDVTETTSKIVGAGLYAFYILSVLALGAMMFGSVKKLFNK